MTLDVKFDEQDTTLKASFGEVFTVGDEGNNLQIDQDVIEESTNAVSGGAVKKYVDDVISQIPKPDDIELDTTLSREGAVADAKATGNAIRAVKDNASSIEYYAVNIAELVANGVGVTNVNIKSEGAGSEYRLSVGMLFFPVIFDNGVQYKLIEAPFDFIYVNQPIWKNVHQFKRAGITSPVIAQELGNDDILWFDTTIPRLMGALGMRENSYELVFGDASDYRPEGQIEVVFTIGASMQSVADQAKGLWDLMLANPETKLIFEYQNQKNISMYDAPFAYSVTPAVDIEEE